MENRTRHSPLAVYGRPVGAAELIGAVLLGYFVFTGLSASVLEGFCHNTETANRLAPLMLPALVTAIMTAKAFEAALRSAQRGLCSITRTGIERLKGGHK